jgi:hypothetical protein
MGEMGGGATSFPEASAILEICNWVRLAVPKKPGLSALTAISPPKAPTGACRNLKLSAACAFKPQVSSATHGSVAKTSWRGVALCRESVMGVSKIVI